MDTARTLAEYADDLTYDDLDDEAIAAVKVRLLDSVACAFAGFGEPPAETAIDYARRSPGSDVPILGGGTASVENATLANGTLVRYADWNDSYFSKEPAHPSDNFGPLLSIAGSEGSSGAELLTATVLAYEIQSRLCDAAALRDVGIDHVTYGLVSSARAGGTLQGASPDELAQAVNVAVSSGVSLRQIRSGEVSSWKAMAFANAARHAVFALDVAREGVTGPAPIFEGRFGLSNLLDEEITIGVEAFGGPSNPYKVTESSIKMYPAFQHAQAAIKCTLDLRETAAFDVEDVERIENETYEIGATILDDAKWDPQTRETADHSQPYCIARALVDGEVTMASFRESALDDPDVRQLIDVMEVRERVEFTDAYGEAFPHRMRIHTGEDVYETEIRFPKGNPRNPLSAEELAEKFRLAAPCLSSEWIETVTAFVEDVERCSDVIELFEIVENGAETLG